MKFNSLHNQNGFALASVMLIITAMAAILTGIVYSQSGEKRRHEAEIAGWEAVQIGRAARIHVRNLMENITPADLAISGAATARQHLAMTADTQPDITIDSLIAANLLPDNFARRDGAGNYFNALGQPIRIIMRNYPLGGDPALETTVPTAFVYFEDNFASSPELNQTIVQSVRAESVPVSAPLYSGGANLSGTCSSANPLNTGAGMAVMWDSGCLDTAEFTALTGDIYNGGSFVLPVWRTVNFDPRALLRFPQPEQTALQTMTVDLSMAEGTEGCATGIIIPDETGGTPSTLCHANDDDVTLSQDNRRSIFNVPTLQSSNLIIDTQSGDDVTSGVYIDGDASDGTADLIISGNLDAIGDAKVFNGVTTVNNELSTDKNIYVSGGGTGFAASSEIGTLSTGQSATNNLVVFNAADIGAEVSVQDNVNNVNTLNATADLISENFITANRGGVSVNVTDNANILQPGAAASLISSTMTVTAGSSIGGSSYSVATARFNVLDGADISGPIGIANNADFNGPVTTGRIDVHNGGSTAECYGDCPLRTESAQCAQAAADGYVTYDDCMDALR